MKLTYFLRGLGVGIIFAAVVFFTAYQTDKERMTDAEIINRAKELGMVEKEDPLKDLLSTQADMAGDKGESKEDAENAALDSTTANSTEDSSATDEKTKMESTTEGTTETSAESKKGTVTIKIDGGSSSYTVCQKLQTAGLIEDANEFDAYLVKNGYASRLRVGEYTLKQGMSFADIAAAISE